MIDASQSRNSGRGIHMGWFEDFTVAKDQRRFINQTEVIQNRQDIRGGAITSLAGLVGLVADQLLTISPTDGGLQLPNLTTAQRDAITSPVNGQIILNTTTQQAEMWNSTTATWEPVFLADPAGVGFSASAVNVGTVAPGAAENVDGLLVARSFFEFNSLKISASGAGPTISNFQLALYDSEASRDAAVLAGTTFDATNRDGFGLVYLGNTFTGFSAALTPPIYQDVLGRHTAVEVAGEARLYGVLLNGDGANSADFVVAAETYPLIGSQA